MICERYVVIIEMDCNAFLPLAEYGSMLSSPSPESHVKSSFGNANNANQLNCKYEAGETRPGSMTAENAVFTARDAILDVDLHWEMNYHEAAIFLEVTTY